MQIRKVNVEGLGLCHLFDPSRATVLKSPEKVTALLYSSLAIKLITNCEIVLNLQPFCCIIFSLTVNVN